MRCAGVLPGRGERVVEEPVLEARREQRRVGAGHQRVVVEHDTEIARLWIGDDATGVVARTESCADEVVEWVPVRATAVATSSAAIGWMSADEIRTVSPFALSTLPVAVVKKSHAGPSSKDGELATSTTTCAPARTSVRP